VMSMWFAWRAAMESAPRYKSFNRLRNPKMTRWGKTTSGRTVKNPYYERSDPKLVETLNRVEDVGT
jgi:hypothetical protein